MKKQSDEEFRILKITQKNKSIYYLIQLRTRLFWIGPKIWETYSEDEFGEDSWKWFKYVGMRFFSVDSVEKKLKSIKYNMDNKTETIEIYFPNSK